MIPRKIQTVCLDLFKKYPIITITGPRQSGKTTLAKTLFPEKPYINFEFPDERRLAIEDPRSLLYKYPDGAILDEIQRTPQIPSYLQGIVDEKKQNSMFILTGSQQFEISQSISQSLAGRTAMIKLLPFSIEELYGCSSADQTDMVIFNGFYPGQYTNSIDPPLYYSNYLETYIERDLRQLSQIDNLSLFEKFIRLLATRVGSLLNASSIANDCGVSVPTIQKWTSLLEASYIAFLLPPFFRNIGKRLIKTPKVYFYDTGLLCFLLGIENRSYLESHPLRGNIFENMVIIDLLKKRYNQGLRSNLFFFRDQTGNEVDIVIEQGGRVIPIEVKSAKTVAMDFCKGLRVLRTLLPNEVKEGYLVYDGEIEPVVDEFKFLNWRNIHQINVSDTI